MKFSIYYYYCYYHFRIKRNIKLTHLFQNSYIKKKKKKKKKKNEKREKNIKIFEIYINNIL